MRLSVIKNKIKITKNKIPWILFSVACIFIVYLYFYSHNTDNKKTDFLKTIESVGKLVVLPKDEVPVIATVTDLNKLKGQEFFSRAKIGNKVLIYQKSKTAILYDPVNNKIVEIAPVSF